MDHTAELELRIDAPTEEALHADALAAFAELVGREETGARARHDVRIAAADPAHRLVEWLQELVFLAETQDFVPERLASIEIGEAELRAAVEGHRGRPAHLVKAVTYHGLEVEQRDDGWHAKVVLDV